MICSFVPAAAGCEPHTASKSNASKVRRFLFMRLTRSLEEPTCPSKNFTSGSGAAGVRRKVRRKRPCLKDSGPFRKGDLMHQHEVIMPVSLPAILVGFGADLFLFSVADGFELARRCAALDQGLLRGAGATVAQSQVVHGGAAFIAVALNPHLPVGMSCNDRRGLG